MVLFALVAPSFAVAGEELEAELVQAQDHLPEGGACGEPSAQAEELVDCGAQARAGVFDVDSPGILALLQQSVVYTTREQCTDLLADIWSRAACQAEGRDCGKILPRAVTSPAPKLLSSSSSGQASLAALRLGAPEPQRLAAPQNQRPPAAVEFEPPTPPPRVLG
jgi:hypothetical protein